MATTFGDVVDRVFRDWLHGPDEQPIVASLDGAVDDSTDTLTLDLTSLTAEEQDALSKGVLLEVDYEQCYITAVSTSTATVRRGANGTTAAAHDDGADVVLLPKWGRQTVLDAVLDDVPRLYPALHARGTTTVTSDSEYVEVPATIKTVTKAYVINGSQYDAYDRLELLTEFGPSSTDTAVQFPGLASGKTVYLAYRGKFARPDGDDTTLSSVDVDETWVPILAVGAAASVVASEDVDKATVEYITRQLEAEQFPVGSSSRIRDGMLRYRQYLLEQARRTQLADDTTTPVVQLPASWP